MDNEYRKKLICVDADGTLIAHKTAEDGHGNLTTQISTPVEILPGVLEKFLEWDVKGYHIIITTGRRESCREITEQQLRSVGLFWDQLVMGVGGGDRHLINDSKPDSDRPTAYAHTVKRNEGLGGVEI